MAPTKSKKKTRRVVASKVTEPQKQKPKATPAKRSGWWARVAAWGRKSRFVKVAVLWLAPFLVLESFYFTEVLKPNNYLEFFPKELWFPTALHIITAVLVALVIYFLPRPRNMAAKLLAALIFGLFLVQYDSRLQLFESVARVFTPILPSAGADMLVISSLLLVLLMALSLGLGLLAEKFLARLRKRRPELTTGNIMAGLFVLLGVMFMSQVTQLVKILPPMFREVATVAPLLPKPEGGLKQPEHGKPDIYYLVFDRYASGEVLREQFSFSNDAFTNGLRSQGFYVDDNAYSNYPYTTMSVASTLNGIYTNDIVEPFKDEEIQSRTLFHNLIGQASVIKALKEAGYTYHHIGSVYGATSRAPLSDQAATYGSTITVFDKQKNMFGLEQSQFRQSPYYRLAGAGSVPWWPINIKENDPVGVIRNQLEALNNLAVTTSPEGGRFVFAHILSPHDPYLFNADGSIAISQDAGISDKLVKDKYLGQLQFMNTQINSLVQSILERSQGKAIILINSDEGPYPDSMNNTVIRTPELSAFFNSGGFKGDMRRWPDEMLKMKYSILQAVHIPAAEPDDYLNMSSVNMFRVVLNRYLGYELPYLPECHIGLNQGNDMEYRQIDLTAKLTGQPEAACRQYQNQED